MPDMRRLMAVATRRKVLGLSLQHQLQDNWCWAACASSASAFFDPASTWGQCAVVNAELKQTSCCQSGSSANCDKPWYLDKALRRTGNFTELRKGPAPWVQVRAEIDAGRPVAARIGWNGGGGHFVMLTGYRNGPRRREFDVQDPWTGSSSVEIEAFKTAYKNAGTWTHTYLTRP